MFFFFSSRRRHTRCSRDWSSDVCSSDLQQRLRRPGHPFEQHVPAGEQAHERLARRRLLSQNHSVERLYNPARVVRGRSSSHTSSTAWAAASARSGPPGSFMVRDRKSTRLNSSHGYISYAVFCLKKKKTKN